MKTPLGPIRLRRDWAWGHLLARGMGWRQEGVHAHVCLCAPALFIQASPHLQRLSGPAQWAGEELPGSPSRAALCQAQPRSASCQGEAWERGQGGPHFSMTSRHVEPWLAKPSAHASKAHARTCSQQEWTLASIRRRNERKKKIPLGTRWRSKRGRVWLCVCVFGGRVGWSERRREDQERGEQE